MTTARANLVDLDATPYYHCMNQCVRRAFLCGDDEYTGKNYDHRKQWIVRRLAFLGAIFAIDICAYAIMSSHFHVVLRVMAHLAQQWSDEEVLRRAELLWPSTTKDFDKWPKSKRLHLIKKWRERLSSLSWFMRELDEHIAREANAEDGCSGRFWARRFESRALLDEGALLRCMAYVDLNPVRAKLAKKLEESDFTSIQQRLREVATSLAKRRVRGQGRGSVRGGGGGPAVRGEQERPAEAGGHGGIEEAGGHGGLTEAGGQDGLGEAGGHGGIEEAGGHGGLTEAGGQDGLGEAGGQILELVTAAEDDGSSSANGVSTAATAEATSHECPRLVPMDDESCFQDDCLPMTLIGYTELLEWTGKQARNDKPGKLEEASASLLQACGIDVDEWLESVERFGALGGFVGHPDRLRERAEQLGQRWIKGQGRRRSSDARGAAVDLAA